MSNNAECQIHTKNCDLYGDGSILCRYGGYTIDNHFIPFISQEEADDYMNNNFMEDVN